MNFNIYVPSYARYNDIRTQNYLEYCTYVVRQSQVDKYIDAGVRDVLPVDDSLICSLQKVTNWIIDETPEDVICIMDDDMLGASYRLDKIERIQNPVVLTQEIERIAQLIYDLGIGMAVTPCTKRLLYYSEPFSFSHSGTWMRWINKAVCKARWSDKLVLSDMEFQLDELLMNRITLVPEYLIADFELDTNSGGNNKDSGKRAQTIIDENYALKEKYGKYWKWGGVGKAGSINVKR